MTLGRSLRARYEVFSFSFTVCRGRCESSLGWYLDLCAWTFVEELILRKLKLQMQMSINGFVAGPKGEMDWMVWNWDQRLKDYVSDLTRPVDCIVLGRVLAEGFIPAWKESVEKDPADEFARKMNGTPKLVFSKTPSATKWDRATFAKGPLAEEINALKAASGGDLIAYGGSTLASELIRHALIDEYYLFVNPTALRDGMPIFREPALVSMKLSSAVAFDCGIVCLKYVPHSN